jgi:hypothetical protein
VNAFQTASRPRPPLFPGGSQRVNDRASRLRSAARRSLRPLIVDDSRPDATGAARLSSIDNLLSPVWGGSPLLGAVWGTSATAALLSHRDHPHYAEPVAGAAGPGAGDDSRAKQ